MHTNFKDSFSGKEEVRHFYVAEDISLVIQQIKVKNQPVDDVVFMEIFKSLEQLFHETFYCNFRD